MTAAARTIGLVGLLALLAAAIVGPLGLLAQSTTGFGAITVLSNTHLVAPNNPDLQHNVPSLQVGADGQTLVADFKTHFESTGGLSRWGYATSEVFVEEKGTLTQYYQRGAVDFHRVGGTYALERRLIWDYFGGGVGGSEDLGVEPGTTNNNSGQTLGPWSHKVSNWAVGGTRTGFLQFFEAVGGVDSLGFPKTEARIDTNQPGTVHMAWAPTGVIRQYFQAGVFEFDPANPAAGVNMALLGDRLRDRLYPDKSEVAVFRGAAALVAGQAYAALVVERDRLATPTPISAPAPTTTPRPQLPSTTAELIVVGTSDAGIAVYDAGAWFKLDVNNSDLTTNLVHAVHADKDGNVWAGTDAGLFKLGRNGRGAGFRGANTSGAIGSDDIRALAGRGSSDTIWMAHPDRGASNFDGASSWGRFRPDNSSLPSTAVRDIFVVDETLGRVWLATSNGAALYEQSTDTWPQTLKIENSGIVSNDITAIAIDGSGRIWFGTLADGLSMTQNLQAWTNFTSQQGLGSDEVRDILAASDGTVWVATSGGVSRLTGSSFTTSNTANSGLPSNSVRALAEDSQGRIWAATDSGVGLFDGSVWRAMRTAHGLASNATTSVAVIPAA